MLNNIVCPCCGEALTIQGKSYQCINHHNFDISKYGYVNLLPPSGTGHHGDDKMMVQARKRFLDAEYYQKLADTIAETLEKYVPSKSYILDAGCGEGYYSDIVLRSMTKSSMLGVDISKDALIAASKRNTNIQLVVASSSSLPVTGDSFDVLMNIFSPLFISEFSRVLKNDGFLLRVVPLENHLMELKCAIYDTPYPNDAPVKELIGFNLIDEVQLEYVINLKDRHYIEDLFKMTPYYYKTSTKDQKKLHLLNEMQVTAAFDVLLYKKHKE